jgi:predicted alpha/beta-fold hydrolase
MKCNQGAGGSVLTALRALRRMTHETWHVFLVSALLVIGLVQFSRYYTAHCIETPRVEYYPTAQNVALMARFREHIRDYAPTPWALSGHINSFLFAYWPLSVVLGLRAPTVVERTLVEMDDGGVVALDWFNDHAADDAAPILVVLPGVVGKWENAYIKRLVLEAQSQGWRAVCKSYRGIGVPMTAPAPETWSSVTTQDFHVCLQRIRARYPAAPIMAAGFSVGGMLLYSEAHSPWTLGWR